MNLDEYPVAFREAVSAHEFMRRLGFPSEAIGIGVDLRNCVVVQILLYAPGLPVGQNASFRLWQLPDDWNRERFNAAWRELASAIHDIPDETLLRYYNESIARRHGEQIALALVAVGVVPPILQGCTERTDATIRKFVRAAASRRSN